jgi:HTH-type transcriptional regulator/antitoxin HigA
LVRLISEYEKATSTLPEVDPVELIKIRMEDFGYKPADLAKEYGDKGTVSKVLN